MGVFNLEYLYKSTAFIEAVLNHLSGYYKSLNTIRLFVGRVGRNRRVTCRRYGGELCVRFFEIISMFFCSWFVIWNAHRSFLVSVTWLLKRRGN